MGEDKTYGCIVLDPNWSYQNYGQKRHGAVRSHYTTSAVEEIAKIPLQRWCSRQTNIFMWMTFPKLQDGFALVNAWDLVQVTGWPWVKTVPHKAEIAKGIGHWAMSTSEVFVALRTHKSAKGPRYKAGGDKPDALLVGDDQVFYARRGAHSRKPTGIYEWIESFFPGPYLELFARDTRVGWDTWGHDTGYHLCEEGVIPYVEAVERGLVTPKEDDPAEQRRKLWTGEVR